MNADLAPSSCQPSDQANWLGCNTIYAHHRHLSLLLSPKADTYFTEGWVNLGGWLVCPPQTVTLLSTNQSRCSYNDWDQRVTAKPHHYCWTLNWQLKLSVVICCRSSRQQNKYPASYSGNISDCPRILINPGDCCFVLVKQSGVYSAKFVYFRHAINVVLIWMPVAQYSPFCFIYHCQALCKLALCDLR